MKIGLYLFHAAFTFSICFAAPQEQFYISSFCDPLFVTTAPGSFDNSKLQLFDDAKFNTMSGVVCFDTKTQPGYPEYGSADYNDQATRLIGSWNSANNKKLRRFIGSIDFGDYGDQGDYHSDSYVNQIANTFGPTYTGPREVIPGFTIGDEVHLDEMQSVNHIRSLIRSISPDALVVANLFPSYWPDTPTPGDFINYVDSYKLGNPNVFTIDNYLFNNIWAKYFSDFDQVSQSARTAGAIFWPILLLSRPTSDPLGDPNEIDLKYQALTALAYGAKGIEWYPYRTLDDHYAGPEDNPTKRNWVTKVNRQISIFGKYLISLQYLETVHGSNFDPATGEKIRRKINPAIMRAENSNLICGVFKDPSGSTTILIGNKNRSNSQTFNFTVPTLTKLEYLNALSGQWQNYTMTNTSGRSDFSVTVNPVEYKILRLSGMNSSPRFWARKGLLLNSSSN